MPFPEQDMFFLYVLTALLVGVVSGVLIGFDKALALLGGYAGLDLIDDDDGEERKNFLLSDVSFVSGFRLGVGLLVILFTTIYFGTTIPNFFGQEFVDKHIQNVKNISLSYYNDVYVEKNDNILLTSNALDTLVHVGKDSDEIYIGLLIKKAENSVNIER